jgi:hypothetical protein
VYVCEAVDLSARRKIFCSVCGRATFLQRTGLGSEKKISAVLAARKKKVTNVGDCDAFLPRARERCICIRAQFMDLRVYGVCPDRSVLWDNSGLDAVERDAWQYGGWMPLVFRSGAFWTFFTFYVAFEVVARRHTRRVLAHFQQTLYRTEPYVAVAATCDYSYSRVIATTDTVPEAVIEASVPDRAVTIVGRYLPSLLHSVTCVMLSLAALARAHGLSGWPSVTFYEVLAHSFGYLLADMIVDQDPVYFSHHVAPLFFGEMMLRCGGSLYHAVVFALVCEIGNVYSHSRAIYLMSVTSPAYNASVRGAIFVTRILSLVPALLVFLCDIPDDYILWCGIGTLLCLLGIYGSNLAALDVAASVDATSVS